MKNEACFSLRNRDAVRLAAVMSERRRFSMFTEVTYTPAFLNQCRLHQPKPVAGLPASAPAVGGTLILHQHLQGADNPICPAGAEVANVIPKGAPLGAMGLGEAALVSPSHLANL